MVSPTEWQSLIMHYMNYYTLIQHQYDTCISRIMSDERVSRGQILWYSIVCPSLLGHCLINYLKMQHIYEPTSYNDPTFGSEKPEYNMS